ncbi:hypothetical protein COOONC_28064 [Cooperia oncophora]
MESVAQYMGRWMEVELTDGRLIRGQMMCTDRRPNFILGRSEERWSGETGEPRAIGLAMVGRQHVHAWINNLSFTNELEPIPEIVSREPYWKEMEREFIALRLRDANVSKDLEESNMYMYSLRLTLAAIEEARWLNDVSKGSRVVSFSSRANFREFLPKIAPLVLLKSEVERIDPKFPIAVNRIPESLGSDGSSAANINGPSGDCPSDLYCPPFEIRDEINAKPTFFRSMRRPTRRPRVVHGTVTGSPSRKPETTWGEAASAALESFVNRETLRDERVSQWMDELVRNTDKASVCFILSSLAFPLVCQ